MDNLTVSFLRGTIALAIGLLQDWIRFLTTEQQKTQGLPFTAQQIGVRIQQLNRLIGSLRLLDGNIQSKPDSTAIQNFNSVLQNVFKEDKDLKLAYLNHRSVLLDKVTATERQLQDCNDRLQEALKQNEDLSKQLNDFSCPEVTCPEVPENKQIVSGGFQDDWWKYTLGLGVGVTVTYLYQKSKQKSSSL